jgi:tetratricopeptide (TPR) repeat protein
MSSQKGRILHARAEQAREKEQDLLKSLKLADEATIAYADDGDYLGIAEVQSSRFIAFKHLHRKTNDKAYLTLAKFAALSAVELSELSDDPKAATLPYFNLGKAYEEIKDYNNAIIYFEKALSSPLPDSHNRTAVKADIKAHLSFAKYKSVDKSGLGLMSEAISELEVAEEQKYEKDVWLSGAHMRAAEMLRQDNPQLAKEHLQKAKEIIDGNPDLKLRAEQNNGKN